jgi:hypothetical protein
MVLFASIVIFSSHSYLSQEVEKTMKKYCDTSLSDEKIKELEKCESDAPEEVCVFHFLLIHHNLKMIYQINKIFKNLNFYFKVEEIFSQI